MALAQKQLDRLGNIIRTLEKNEPEFSKSQLSDLAKQIEKLCNQLEARIDEMKRSSSPKAKVQEEMAIKVNEMLDTLERAVVNMYETAKTLATKLSCNKYGKWGLVVGGAAASVVGPVMAADIAQKFAEPQAGYVQVHNPDGFQPFFTCSGATILFHDEKMI